MFFVLFVYLFFSLCTYQSPQSTLTQVLPLDRILLENICLLATNIFLILNVLLANIFPSSVISSLVFQTYISLMITFTTFCATSIHWYTLVIQLCLTMSFGFDNHRMLLLLWWFLTLSIKALSMINWATIPRTPVHLPVGYCLRCYLSCVLFHVAANHACKYLLASTETSNWMIVSLVA